MSVNVRKTIELPEIISVRELAEKLNASPIDIIKKLMANGIMANINQQIDFDTAALVIDDMGYDATPLVRVEEATAQNDSGPEWRQRIAAEETSELQIRPPVVTIMGHVDHGKTSLLDAIRNTHVAEGEAGGITQHIGAYQIEHQNRKITFLDTPGHAAFTAMRARGAQTTDIAVLVVAADDGVMPQTREAAAHAKAAGVPILVAMNKIDRPNANLDRLKTQLAEIDLVPDDWDGNTIVVPVSAKQKKGIEDLLEAILLVADENPIQANPNAKRASGTVIESRVERGRGVVATLLVQNGTLRENDSILVGTVTGRIRAMFNDRGEKITSAPPSTPVSVIGLPDVPVVGELFETVESASEGRRMAEERRLQARADTDAAKRRKPSLEQLFASVEAGETKEIVLVVKVDVQGSLEPVVQELEKLSTPEVKLKIIYQEVGNISESDILLASASKAIVIGFNVEIDHAAQRNAESEGIDVRLYNVIYRMTEDIEKALKGQLDPVYEDKQIGRAEVRAVFKAGKFGKVAGCYVVEGEIHRNAIVKVQRQQKIVYEGTLSSLKRERDDVKEVRMGYECGIGLDKFNDYREGDVIVAYEKVQVN